MNIQQIRLANFKLFDKLQIDTKPLTLLTGANSSGKSSILHALSSITQTEGSLTFPFHLTANGKNCLLGSYRDIVFKNNTQTPFSIGISAYHGKTSFAIDASYRYSARGDHILPSKVKFRSGEDVLDVIWAGHEQGYELHANPKSLRGKASDKEIDEFYKAVRNLLAVATKESGKKGKVKRKKPPVEEFEAYYRDRAKLMHKPHHIGRVSPHELPDKIGEVPQAFSLLHELQAFVKAFSEHVAYVGPVRAVPLRYYPPDIPHLTLDPTGANCIPLLLEWRKHHPERYRRVETLVETLELATGFRPETTPDEIVKMQIQPFAHKETVNLADVGFGLSQALPFLVADVSLPDGGTLLINQPEVHLHPPSQAKLANYFVSRLDKRQYIVETHSEYLINRLRLLAMQGKVKTKDVAIVFFGSPPKDSMTPRKYVISLTTDGSLKGAPDDFFKTYYVDSFELAMGGPSND